jgi:phosphoribosylformimino-5-aminoimidazole carboxamide ribotide isomerase
MIDLGFTLFPAIDLRYGQVVRLVQGDPTRQTTYANDPAVVACGWLEAGARWLHVVNLDGAFGEAGGGNQDALEAILVVAENRDPSAHVQFGGGLRSIDDIERALSAGVSRAIIGSLAVETPELAAKAVQRFGPERIALAVDVRDGEVQRRGWVAGSGWDPIELGCRFRAVGLQVCIYTEISRDGGGRGIDVDGTQRFAEATGLKVIASGGAASLADVRAVRAAGLSGLILGKALYDGDVDLVEALQC